MQVMILFCVEMQELKDMFFYYRYRNFTLQGYCYAHCFLSFDANRLKCKSTKQLFMYFVLQTFPLQNFAVDFFSILRCLQNKMFNNSRVQFLTVTSLGCQVHSAQSNVVPVLGVNCKVIYRY